jgi:hypothetical protein
MADLNRQAIGVTIVQAPALLFRVGLQYLRMKRSANKARGRFYAELVRGGVPKRQAKELADDYASVVSVRSILQALRSTTKPAWL